MEVKYKRNTPRPFSTSDDDDLLEDTHIALTACIIDGYLKVDELGGETESFVVTHKENKRLKEKLEAARLHMEQLERLRIEDEEKIKHSEMLKRVEKYEKEQELQQKFEAAQLAAREAAREAELDARVDQVVNSLVDNVIAEFAEFAETKGEQK